MKSFFYFFLLPVILIISFVLFFMPRPAEGELPIRTINEDWGTVTSINNCQKRKHSLYCEVVTDTVRFDKIDITDFPYKYLKVGDKISLKVEIFKKSYHTYYVKNNSQISISSCFWLMPCFDKYK